MYFEELFHALDPVVNKINPLASKKGGAAESPAAIRQIFYKWNNRALE